MNKGLSLLNRYADLPAEEVRLLCFIAYYGDDANAGAYCRLYKQDNTEYRLQAGHLQELGYLETHEHVSAVHYLDALEYLSVCRQDWQSDYRTLSSNSPTKVAEYLWKLTNLLCLEDFDGAAKLYPPYEGLSHRHFNLFPYIKDRAMHDSRYAMLLEGDQRKEMIGGYMEKMMAEGTLDSAAIDGLRKIAGKCLGHDQELADRIRLYEWLATGRYEQQEKTTSMWGLAMSAVRALYEGRIEDAFSLFQNAEAKQTPALGAFPSPILNFLYAVCLLRYSRKYGRATTAINALRTASAIRYDNTNLATRLLLEYGELSTEDIQDTLAKKIQFFDTDTQGRGFSMLMTAYLGLPHESLGMIQSPSVLRHELSAFVDSVPESTRQELERSFGGKPLLQGLHRKASWEVMLNEIDTVISKSADTPARRIIYFLSESRLSCMMEQRKTDGGEWKDERVLSVKQFCTDGYDSMNTIDTGIAAKLARKEGSQTDADILIPALNGTGRLFSGTEYAVPRMPAVIITEPPYLGFHNEQGMIAVSSNVKISETGLPCKHTVSRTGGKYILTNINPLQADVLGKILKRDRLPASAAPTLNHTIHSLEGIIEVREDILANMEENAIRSEGCLAVRIEPLDKGKEYRVTLLAAPLRNGVTRTVPGEGELFVLDEDEEHKSHCVQRLMERECESLSMLTHFLLEFETEQEGNHVFGFSSDVTLLHLLNYCYRYQDRFVPEWPQGKPLKFKGILTENDIDIEVKSDIDWFSIEGEARIGGRNLPLEKLIAACTRAKGDFVQIGEDEYIRLTDTLKKHIAQLDAVLRKEDNQRKKSIPKYLAGALSHALEGINYSSDNGYLDFLKKMKDAFETDYEVPSGFQATLRPYQKEGYEWMRRMDAWGAGVCLADDMGLGKTVQTLAFLLSRSQEGPSIVVAPKSVTPNWAVEALRFAPGLRVTILNEVEDRITPVREASPGDVILCTYGILTTESDLLASKSWNVICLDEAQQIKNHNTLVSQAAMDLTSRSRIILTGTPLQNNVGELWNLMQFINPGLLGRWNVFRDTYVNALLDEEHRDMLKEMTQPFILRRTKQEVLTDLPEKTEGTFYVDLNRHESEVYEEMRRILAVKFKKNKNREERKEAGDNDIMYLSELMRLREACCDMRLLYEGWKYPGSKVTALMEILSSLIEVPDNGILVFSQFTSFLDIVREEVKKRGWEYLYIDGQTSMKERRKCVEQFQSGARKLFLSSLKAGGLGLNLTAANYVILLDPWWNPAIEHQATDRAHRLGQQRSVSVVRLICRNTIEEKILRLHEKKQHLSDDLLDGTSESNHLTYEEILDMVAPF